MLDQQVHGPEQVQALAELPSRDVLLSMIVQAVEAPLTQLVGAVEAVMLELVRSVDAVAEQKKGAE